VIVDVRMPGLNGIDFQKALIEHGQQPSSWASCKKRECLPSSDPGLRSDCVALIRRANVVVCLMLRLSAFRFCSRIWQDHVAIRMRF
jgi:hypothetical protein